MPTTRKKIIKTIYKDDDDNEDLGGDFSDSGSEAIISSAPSSDDSIHEEEICPSSDDEVHKKSQKLSKTNQKKNPRFAKAFISKINKQIRAEDEDEQLPVSTFTIKDLTEADKLLPSVLNLSESDSSDDEYPKSTIKQKCHTETIPNPNSDNDDNDSGTEYKDVWSFNERDESEDIAKKTFLELEQHNAKVEEAKMSALQYSHQNDKHESDVKDLLALGEEVPELETITKEKKKKVQEQSDSEVEDWEEVKESKAIPQQGIQLIVNIPDSVLRKTKKVDVEDMMRRKINRVKKECQVYMHKVHVLCWLGYGNYISTVLNDQELMSTALSLLMNPKSKGNPGQRVSKKKIEETCSLSQSNSTFYPGQRVDLKYVEQITSWYQNKLTLRKDKHEGKFRPKAPKLKELLIEQIKNNNTLTSKKYLVFVFVALLRALGLQCRVMLNFVTVPIKPPTSELQSLSKNKSDIKKSDKKDSSKDRNIIKTNSVKTYTKKKIPQLDGNHDDSTDSDISNIMKIDGNDNKSPRITRSTRSYAAEVKQNKQVVKKSNTTSKIIQVDGNNDDIAPKTRSSRVAISKENKNIVKETEGASPPKRAKQNEDNVSGQVVGNKKLSLNSQRNQKAKNIKFGNNTEVSQVEEINKDGTASEFFVGDKNPRPRSLRKRSATTNLRPSNDMVVQKVPKKATQAKTRAKSTPVRKINSKSNEELSTSASKKPRRSSPKEQGNKDVLKPIDMIENDSYKDDSVDDTKTPKSDSDDDFKVVKVFATHPKRAKKMNSSKQKEKLSTQDITKDQNKQNEKEKTNSPFTAKTRSARAGRKTKIVPKIVVSAEENKDILTSEFFTGENKGTNVNKTKLSRKRSTTTNSTASETVKTENSSKTRAKSTPRNRNTCKYFKDLSPSKKEKNVIDDIDLEDEERVSHKELLKQKTKANNDVTSDLVDMIKNRVKDEKAETKKNKVKRTSKDSEEDSDHLPVEDVKQFEDSDDDFKPVKIRPKPGTSRRIDRRVLSDDIVLPDNIDVWCEVFVEELEEWVPVDVTRNKVHCASEVYSKATHPVAYIIGWDNNNYLKDLTRRYVPHWNTVTRKQRAEVSWWNTAVAPWLGPKTARDKEEDERLDRMQLEAPLPTCISEYKNHPLYALKRHLLKFEALYPPDAASLGFVRGEPVYARECVHVCKSRDIWLKEAKVVRLGEKPYKVVTARPKWDKLSNKLIRDKPLEIFGPWQITDYEPPVAENGIVPRNAYGNVELFKECMLPKGTVYIKLPGLNRVAKKLNIDCAPALTGFDFNGGWSHPVYEGFVVCKEYEEILTEAWVKDQEELERKEREKIDARVYGNWRRLIKGLFIREKLKVRYGFDGPTPGTSQVKKKQKGPRLVVKKTR